MKSRSMPKLNSTEIDVTVEQIYKYIYEMKCGNKGSLVETTKAAQLIEFGFMKRMKDNRPWKIYECMPNGGRKR